MSFLRYSKLTQFLFATSIGLSFTAATRAGDPVTTERANELVAKALRAEAEGELLERNQLLTEASRLSNSLPEANWFQGKLQDTNGEWVTIDESVDEAKDQSLLDEYESHRAKLTNTVQGHWQLATWCAKKNLVDQCRAHLNAILKLDSDNSSARQVLGFQQLEGEWISPERISELAEQTQVTQRSLEMYCTKIQQLLRTGISKETTANRFAEINDPLAIPAMEMAASTMGDEAAKHVVAWLSTIDTPEASQSLSRFALNYPASYVREMATKQLCDRPLYDYMPDLLAALTRPIQASLVPALDRRGNLVGYRQAFTKEAMDESRVVLIDRMLTSRGRMAQLGISRNQSTLFAQIMAQDQLVTDAVIQKNRSDVENIDIRDQNRKIVALVSEVTKKEFVSIPNDVWKWWDEYNESNYQDYKPARYRRDTMSISLPQTATCECFVAGTLISTQRGLRPVEKIEVGDMALSRNTSTGELCWKPVIACTTRPPEPTVKFDVDDAQLQCTAGHLLWVSGKGWTKASQIKEGDLLHTASDPAVVTKVIKANVAPTFNLEIAENHTYFVGNSRVLSHDVTPRGVSRELVPGQLRISKR